MPQESISNLNVDRAPYSPMNPDNQIKSKKSYLRRLLPGVIIPFVVIAAILLFFRDRLSNFGITPVKPKDIAATEIKKFKDVADFKSYLSKVSSLTGMTGLGLQMRGLDVPVAAPDIGAPSGFGALEETQVPARVSETNVQVPGIDEPDIVKTDGKSIFVSNKFPFYYGRIEAQPFVGPGASELILPPTPSSVTNIIKAYPPANLASESKIDKTGDLLLSNNTLVIFSQNSIYGFDVKDTQNPKESWKLELDSRNSVLAGRLLEGKIYVVTQQNINTANPCPIPLSQGRTSITVVCPEIYYPTIPTPVDVTYTVLLLNPSNGSVDKRISFVGSSSTSVTYMSSGSIFVTYTFNENLVNFFYNFLSTEGSDLVGKEVLERLKELSSYNISDSSRFTELSLILEQYYSGLSDDERRKIEVELENRRSNYMKNHARELQKTAIVKVKIPDLTVASTGTVAGTPLNQFAMDEYKGNLRIATTTGSNWFSGQQESVNDVYVLDSNLNVIGSITDLGLTERIYSARFVADLGYLVTFRQIDPFYVLDLKDPKNPKKTGELKVPGFSSYLHPIDSTRVLGVGQEGSSVKLSLFDVSNPASPLEASKYILDSYWTQVSESHHAFLLDDKHKIFFLPAGSDGHVFSYDNNVLKLERVVTGVSAQRAIYIDDYLYIIGDAKIVVLFEIDYTEVNSLSF